MDNARDHDRHAENGGPPSLDITIPAIDELAALGARFVCWRWETRNGKATKPPINPHTGGYADTTDPATWADLGTAMAAVDRFHLDGVGPVLDAATDGIVGIDLDGCRDASTGKIADWATGIVRKINSYTEISPSGTGAKIYCRADPVPKLFANKRTIGKAANGAKPPAVEVYTTGRYFCITGQMLDAVPDEICDSTEALEQLAAWIAKAKPAPELPAPFLAMLERDAKLREAWENGTKIGQGGDTSASGLDWSLARHLRPHLDNGDLEAVLRCYQHGQIGSGRLKGKQAERRIARILDEIGERPTKAKGEAKLLPFKLLDELKLSTAPFWLIDGYLVRSPMMMIYGPGGTGKTYLGVSVAIGMLLAQWFGHAAEPGSVLICSFERHDDSEDRLAALRDRHGMAGKGLPLALVDMTGQCLDADAEARIIVTAKAIVEQSARPMRAILIDTTAAACGGREQTPGLQGELRDAGNRIAAATGAIVVWIQHEGKTSHNGPIGYLDLANSCSTWWRIEEREDGSRVVHVDKANRGQVHVPLFAFRLVPFTAGQDDNGKDIVLCDLEEVALDGALASPPRQPFGKPKSDKPAAGQGSQQKTMLAELRKLLHRHPDGVARDLLKSHFVMKVAERRTAEGKPSLTPRELSSKFTNTLKALLAPTSGDPLIEEHEDGTLTLGDGPC